MKEERTVFGVEWFTVWGLPTIAIERLQEMPVADAVAELQGESVETIARVLLIEEREVLEVLGAT